MIELKFYRDDEYVYINNPDGTTKKVPIEDFESAVSGGGGLTVVGYMIASIDEQNPVSISPKSASEVTLDVISYFTDMSFSDELQNPPTYSDWSLVGFNSPLSLKLVSIIQPMIDDLTDEVSPPAMMLYNGGSSLVTVSTDCGVTYLLLNRR